MSEKICFLGDFSYQYLHRAVLLKDIAQLCIDYDERYGEHPESRLEGKGVMEYIVSRLNNNELEELL